MTGPSSERVVHADVITRWGEDIFSAEALGPLPWIHCNGDCRHCLPVPEILRSLVAKEHEDGLAGSSSLLSCLILLPL